MMDEARFWQLIEESRAAAGGDDVAAQCRELEYRVAELAPEDIRRWDAYFMAWQDALRLEKLWGACFLFSDGCSDDGFEYFNRWVMSRGREAAVAAMHDPDSLADHLAGQQPMPEAECLSAAWNAHRRATGEYLPEAVPEVSIDAPDVEDWPEDFDFEDDPDELRRRLPRIAALAGAQPGSEPPA